MRTPVRQSLRARLQGACIGAGIVMLFWSFVLPSSDQGSVFSSVLEPVSLFTQRCSVTTTNTGPTLGFRTCGNFPQERVSLMMGLTIGWLMNRTIVWPSQVYLHAVPILELPRFTPAAMSGLSETLSVHLKQHPPSFYRIMATKLFAVSHIELDCAFLALDASPELEVTRFLWHAHDALRPPASVQAAADTLINTGKAGGCRLVVVAAPSDPRWHYHCVLHDKNGHCLSNATLASTLLGEAGVSSSQKVLLTHSIITSGQRFASLIKSGTPITSRAILGDRLHPDQLAAAEYEASLAAQVYIGHSSLLSSALILLRRMDNWQPLMWHNAGGFPAFLPSIRLLQRRYAPLPWLVYFTQHAAQDNAQLVQLKRAINSALEHSAVRVFCLYDGQEKDSIVAWLQERGVRVILVISSVDAIKAHPSTTNTPPLVSPWYPLLQSLASSSPNARRVAELSLQLTALTHASQHPLLRGEEALLITSSAVLFRSPLMLFSINSHTGALSCGAANADTLPGRLYPSFECDPSVLLLRTTLLHGGEYNTMREHLLQRKLLPTNSLEIINIGFLNAISSLPVTWSWKPHWSGHALDAALVHFAGDEGVAAYTSLEPGSKTQELCAKPKASCAYWVEVWNDVSIV